MTSQRERSDQCPGITRPWLADDGPLVRVRVPGGRLSADQWHGLAAASERFGDGQLHLTSRANLQVRGVRDVDAFGLMVEAVGLLPSRPHDLVRNIMCSALTGVLGGLADLRPVLERLDAEIIRRSELAQLPGKFLIALDDGRGDVAGLPHDLGCFVVAENRAQILVDGRSAGEHGLDEVPTALIDLMIHFQHRRESAWHVRELKDGAETVAGTLVAIDLPAYHSPPLGELAPGVVHHAVCGGHLSAAQAQSMAMNEVVVTPLRSLILLSDPSNARGVE